MTSTLEIFGFVFGLVGIVVGLIAITVAKRVSAAYADYARKLTEWQVEVQHPASPQEKIRDPGGGKGPPMPTPPEFRFLFWLGRRSS